MRGLYDILCPMLQPVSHLQRPWDMQSNLVSLLALLVGVAIAVVFEERT